MDVPRPEMRVGDRERREVDDRLQAAMADGMLTPSEYDERAAQCWTARTRADLDALTRDLPESHLPDRPGAPAPVARVDRVDPVPAPARRPSRAVGGLVVVALGFAGLAGLRVFGADDGASVFGSRVVPVGATQDRVQVGTLFGSTRVQVPDGVRVRTTGTIVFGSVSCGGACRADAGPREIVVEANGGFGSVVVVTDAEVAAEAAEEAAEEAREAAEEAREDAEDRRGG